MQAGFNPSTPRFSGVFMNLTPYHSKKLNDVDRAQLLQLAENVTHKLPAEIKVFYECDALGLAQVGIQNSKNTKEKEGKEPMVYTQVAQAFSSGTKFLEKVWQVAQEIAAANKDGEKRLPDERILYPFCNE